MTCESLDRVDLALVKPQVVFQPSKELKLNRIWKCSYGQCFIMENSAQVFLLKMMPPTENMFFSRVSRCLCSCVNTVYIHTKEECGWGINLRSTSCLNISQAESLKGFRASGVHKIKAKFRQVILTEALQL